jgi:acetolactate synthase-1/2/3 large subunit
MTGADLLCDTLLVNGIDVCFANPGTSEMAFVAALDRKPEMRCILGLFEGAVTGAADGYGRMTGRPAATLLHTGPGLANGLANLHNARRARTPMVNVVGDHASYHLKYDAPLTSDIESLARPMSDWVRRATGPADVGAASEAAIVAARTLPGIATLILPADAAWGEVTPTEPRALTIPPLQAVPQERVREIGAAIRGKRIGLLVGGEAAYGEALEAADRICAATGGQLLTTVLPARVARGRGRPNAERIPYPIDLALATLKDLEVLLLVGAQEPVAFFGYQGKPGRLVPEGCAVLTLAEKGDDKRGALLMLADELGAANASSQRRDEPLADDFPSGPLTGDAMSAIVAQMLPENAIVVDEALTSMRPFSGLVARAAPNDYLTTVGGSIGLGIPAATGAAVACPDRKVVNLESDGCGMYTVQALWTQARERLDVLTIVCSNRAYAILKWEMANLGFNQIGRNASRMMDLDDPPLDWVSLARGMGVEGARADTCERFADLVRTGLSRNGPFLIEAMI